MQGPTMTTLPYEDSIYFVVRKIDDLVGFLPERILLGINKNGVHFFRLVPKEYLFSVELRDILQFGCTCTSVIIFKMRVAGVLHVLQFETEQNEDIFCVLNVYRNDLMQMETKVVATDLSEVVQKLEEELSVAKSTLAIKNSEIASLQSNLKELEELREMKKVNDATKHVSSKEIMRLKRLVAYWKEQAGRRGDEEDLEEIQEDC